MARTLQGDIRTKILDAARDRMHHYGFKKTTIDEIAADAGVGKGTVYLYFDSKEDLALAILVQFKERTILRMQEIGRAPDKTISAKLTEMLSFPIIEAQESCNTNPGSIDIIMSVRPHIQSRLRPYLEHETAVIAEVLELGNQQGLLDVADTMSAARTLKYMVNGFWPPYPCIADQNGVGDAIRDIVNLAIRGMRKSGGRDHNLLD